MATVSTGLEGLSDLELIKAVREGKASAYKTLYRRHVASAYKLARRLARSSAEADDLVSDAFAKVLDMLRAGRGPDSAFRAYLLKTLRNTAYDKTSHDRKIKLSDEVPENEVGEGGDEAVLADLERTLAARAFARLPERWRAVLWYTEVERKSSQEVAAILGLTRTGVTSLAHRAREGFRQSYLQVHLADTFDQRCQTHAEKLGAWTRGGLAEREKTQVERHLGGCEPCRGRAAELADVNASMRMVIAPIMLGVGITDYLGVGAAKIAPVTTATAAGLATATSIGPRQLIRAAAMVMMLAGAAIDAGCVVVDRGDHPHPPHPATVASTTVIDSRLFDPH